MPAVCSQCSIPFRQADNDTLLVRNIAWHFKSNSSRVVKAHLCKINTMSEIVPGRICFIELKSNTS